MRYYLVGGAVRDLLLGIVPHEFDLAFDGPVSGFLQVSTAARKVGKHCPVYIANGHDHMPLRGATIAEDLAGRDFTINALALDTDGVIHSLPQSFADLRAGCIRHASSSTFSDDPARVFRAARFAATLPGFHIHPETLDLMRQSVADGILSGIAAERVGRECMKAFGGGRPALFLSILAEVQALSPWLTELDQACAIPAGPVVYHGEDTVFTHTLAVMEQTFVHAANLSPSERALAVWMALCHDLGKINTDPELLPRHIGHEQRGEKMAKNLAGRLRLPTRWEKAGMLTSRLHMKSGTYPQLRPGTRVDLLHTLHSARIFAPFLSVVMADTGNTALADMAQKDLIAMLSVTLPPAFHNQGQKSAIKLRELRVKAIVSGGRCPPPPPARGPAPLTPL